MRIFQQYDIALNRHCPTSIKVPWERMHDISWLLASHEPWCNCTRILQQTRVTICALWNCSFDNCLDLPIQPHSVWIHPNSAIQLVREMINLFDSFSKYWWRNIAWLMQFSMMLLITANCELFNTLFECVIQMKNIRTNLALP